MSDDQPEAQVTDPEPNEAPEASLGDEQPPAPVDPLEQARAEAARLKDQLLRTAADFDNFRKRSRRELVEAEQRGSDTLLKELLPVFDNLERATQHAESATALASLAEGIAMVVRQFNDTLGRMNIERVPGVGTPFDPVVHEAIQHLATAEHPPGSIAHEVQAGYRQGERLIRPAMVVVAKAPEPPTDAS